MKTTTLSAILVLTATVTAIAQQGSYSTGTTAGPSYSPSLSQGHASTWQEGTLRGWADFARGVGDYNYNSSLAGVHHQEAISRSLDNSKKRVETYFEMRKLNREYTALEHGPRPTQEDLIRYAKLAAPKRLSLSEYEPALGVIFWPAILQRDEFAKERDAIDRAMANRTAKDGLGSETSRQVKALVFELSERLKLEINNLSPAEYTAARKFLTSLDYEMQLKPQTAGIAAR